jgi:NAD(P)-dependent dehydrogenase (short-subunit alcohol dehydrogenase family)
MADKKYVIVTGATGAIGKSIARLLAEKDNYDVTVVGRDERRTSEAVEILTSTSGSSTIAYEICDLSRKEEIMALAKRWNKPLHILVNNAAVTPRRREETPEGIEMQWATNVLGYFWMMKYFAPIMEQHVPARIVNVASYWAGNLDLDDPEFKRRRYNNDTAYRQSKQADRMLTVAFANRLIDKNITVNSCHPGDVRSTLASNLGYGGHETPDQGAENPVWVATADELEGISGKYFEHLRESPCRFGQDHELVEALYSICENY